MTVQTIFGNFISADASYLVIFGIFFFLGIFISYLILKIRHTHSIRDFEQDIETIHQNHQENLKKINETIIQQKNVIDALNIKNTDLTIQNNNFDKNIAVLKQENIQIKNLKTDLDEKKEKINELIQQNTRYQMMNAKLAAQKEEEKNIVKEKINLLAEYKKEINVQKDQNRDIIQENIEFQKRITELQTQNEEERKITKEKISLLNSTKEELKNQFTILANSIFDQKSKVFTDLNKEKLDIILKPFNEELKGFRQKINEVYINEAKERSSLKNELENLKNLNQRLNKEAINLTRALKGDKKTQGTWGELILENVLEQSGLRKGFEYDTQTGFRDNENKLLKPDVIIHLPEGKDIVIDSKVSLVDYEKYSVTANEKEQASYLTAHVNAIRNHINALNSKDYTDLKGVKSLDFILMFIPIEPAFMIAFQHDEKLFSDAFKSRIVIVTPTTLLATLRTIENIWRYEKQNQNTVLIADKASIIYDKFRGFVEDIEKLGNQISTVHNTYDKAFNKLTRGRGNLISQTQQFVDLGIKVKKELPKSVLKNSDLKYNKDFHAIEHELEHLN